MTILNDEAVRALFHDEEPLGQQVDLNGLKTVVGIVRSVRQLGPEGGARPQAFVPGPTVEDVNGAVILRVSRRSASVMPAREAAIWSEFPDVAIPEATSFAQYYHRLTAQREFNMLVFGLFGSLAIAIAAAGIYGVMADVVAQQTREFGLRMALGALPARIVRSTLRRASSYLLFGVAAGLAASWPLARLAERFLFSIQPHDPAVYAMAASAVFVSGLVSTHSGSAGYPRRSASGSARRLRSLFRCLISADTALLLLGSLGLTRCGPKNVDPLIHRKCVARTPGPIRI